MDELEPIKNPQTVSEKMRNLTLKNLSKTIKRVLIHPSKKAYYEWKKRQNEKIKRYKNYRNKSKQQTKKK